MKIHSFQEMLSEYGFIELEPDDKASRVEMLVIYQYSVIVEGGFMEFDNLNKWIEINLGLGFEHWLFYGKTGYDFGFAEYFFADELHAMAVTEVIQYIYTIYPASYPPNLIVKSNGYNEDIVYDPNDGKAIVIRPEEH